MHAARLIRRVIPSWWYRIALLACLPALLIAGAAAEADRRAPSGDVERVSYALGHQVGRDLRRLGKTLEGEIVRQGLIDGLSGAPPALEDGVMQEVLQELKRRIQSDERIREREEDAQLRRQGQEFLAGNETKPGIVTLPSGLQYEVLREGAGPSPGSDDKVTVHYRGITLDGKVFHDSRARPGAPETLHVSGTIAGLTEALQRMKPGARWRIFLPPDLAYGRRGPLAHHTVIFEVELMGVVGGDEKGEGQE